METFGRYSNTQNHISAGEETRREAMRRMKIEFIAVTRGRVTLP